MKMTKLLTILLCLITALSLTGCGYQKPEKYSIQELSVDSITTVCKTDCSLSDVNVATTDSSCSASYQYTDVADDKGISDAKTYHEYLKAEKTCVKIDDFNEANGSYTAYIGNPEVAKQIIQDNLKNKKKKESVDNKNNADNKEDSENKENNEPIAAGFSIKVTFTKDSYTVTMTDNVILNNVLLPQSK